ncbi:MAG: hypothetical protein VB877_06930 [Pirellulaceae bacterium]
MRLFEVTRTAYLLIAAGTLATLLMAILVGAGGLDRLSNDGSVDGTVALQALGLYWVLGVLIVLAVTYRRRYWKQYLLTVGAVVLACGTLEVTLRVLYPALSLPKFRHLWSAQQHHVAEANRDFHLGYFEGEHVFVHTNNDGLRSQYDRTQFQALGTRIACLGDSFTFGSWVQDDEAFPSQLEQRLRKKLGRQDVGVLNAGIMSYSPLLQEKMLQRVVQHYKPQLVLLMLDCTDIGDDYDYGLDYDPQRQEPGPFNGPALSRPYPYYGALWRLLNPYHNAILAPVHLVRRLGSSHQPFDPHAYYKFHLEINGAVETERFFIYRHPLQVTRPYFDASWENIKRIEEKCREIGARFILVVSPRFHHWNPKECPHNWEAFAYGLDEPHQDAIFDYFDEQATTASFPVHTMLKEFQATRESPLVFQTDPHWNSRGHRFVAERLVELLAREAPEVLGEQQ